MHVQRSHNKTKQMIFVMKIQCADLPEFGLKRGIAWNCRILRGNRGKPDFPLHGNLRAEFQRV